MKIECDNKGIHVKKLFHLREISYSEIISVVLSNEEYVFTTKTGEVLKDKRRFWSNYTPFMKQLKNSIYVIGVKLS